MRFSAHIIPGSGTARAQHVPTLNLSLDDIPSDLAEGIYACRVGLEYPDVPIPGYSNAVMHFGPRPVHGLPTSCEIHLLDQVIEHAPTSMEVEIVKRIRDVRNFDTAEQLRAAIQSDLAEARAILTV